MYYSSGFCNKFIKVLSKTYDWEIKDNFIIIRYFSKQNYFYIPYLPYGNLDEEKLKFYIINNNISNYSFKTLDINKDNKIIPNNSRVTMRIDNNFISTQNFWDSLHYKERNTIRKALKCNLMAIKCSNEDELSIFYDKLIKSYNHHGTLIPKYELFLNLYNDSLCDFYIVKFKNIYVGSFCAFVDNQLTSLLYLNIDKKYQSMNISDFIVWKFINIYFKSTKIFDLGTCKYQSGNYYFKKKYLSYEVIIKIITNNKSNIYNKYKLFIIIWKILPNFCKLYLSNIFNKYLGDY